MQYKATANKVVTAMLKTTAQSCFQSVCEAVVRSEFLQFKAIAAELTQD